MYDIDYVEISPSQLRRRICLVVLHSSMHNTDVLRATNYEVFFIDIRHTLDYVTILVCVYSVTRFA